ncbi:hypothetical protein [Corynebacterium glaucum]|uniref:hypothetical protein n=1 Tax=Corynebacterium glaucum TaxID=187491 RepID=UPI00265972E5|nr:hypothetical protein [Corynebacterium glaucum]
MDHASIIDNRLKAISLQLDAITLLLKRLTERENELFKLARIASLTACSVNEDWRAAMIEHLQLDDLERLEASLRDLNLEDDDA